MQKNLSWPGQEIRVEIGRGRNLITPHYNPIATNIEHQFYCSFVSFYNFSKLPSADSHVWTPDSTKSGLQTPKSGFEVQSLYSPDSILQVKPDTKSRLQSSSPD